MIQALAAARGAQLLVFGLLIGAWFAIGKPFETPAGRIIIALAACVIAWAGQGLALAIWPRYPGFQLVTLGLVLAITGVGVWLVVLLIRQQTRRD